MPPWLLEARIPSGSTCRLLLCLASQCPSLSPHASLPHSLQVQVREIRLDYREATGPCKARARAQALWAGEAFCLQLDAHMRFAPGWDAALTGWLKQAEAVRPGSKPVLSTNPPGYEVPPPSWAAVALRGGIPHPHNTATLPHPAPCLLSPAHEEKSLHEHAQLRQHLPQHCYRQR